MRIPRSVSKSGIHSPRELWKEHSMSCYRKVTEATRAAPKIWRCISRRGYCFWSFLECKNKKSKRTTGDRFHFHGESDYIILGACWYRKDSLVVQGLLERSLEGTMLRKESSQDPLKPRVTQFLEKNWEHLLCWHMFYLF